MTLEKYFCFQLLSPRNCHQTRCHFTFSVTSHKNSPTWRINFPIWIWNPYWPMCGLPLLATNTAISQLVRITISTRLVNYPAHIWGSSKTNGPILAFAGPYSSFTFTYLWSSSASCATLGEYTYQIESPIVDCYQVRILYIQDLRMAILT